MDHPGPWSAYSQHYGRIGGGVNAAPAGGSPTSLGQAGHQLNELGSLSASLQRQDPMVGTFAGGAPPHGPPPPGLLLPTHPHPHGHPSLNVSLAQGGVGTDAGSFVNSAAANLLGSTYDPMLTTFQNPPAASGSKGHHLGAINMAAHHTAHHTPPHHPHGASTTAIFKAMGKETEINELRGGFSRRGDAGGMVRAASSAGGFFEQTPNPAQATSPSPHTSWRPSNLMPTPSSPFGVLPHESVMHRGAAGSEGAAGPPVSSTNTKSHSHSTKALGPAASSVPIPTNAPVSDATADMGYRTALAVAQHANVANQGLLNCSPSPRPSLMMPPVSSTENLTPNLSSAPSPDSHMGLSIKPPADYIGYHGNVCPGVTGSTRTGLLSPQSYQQYTTTISPATSPLPGLEMHGNAGVLKTTGVPPANMPLDMYGAPLPSSSAGLLMPLPAHNASGSNNNNGNNSNNNRSQPSSASATSVQNQPRDLSSGSSASSYSPYNTGNPAIPTNSQSFLANQMPSPLNSPSPSSSASSHSQQHQHPHAGMDYGGGQSVGVIATAGAGGRYPPTDNPNVAYSSVITRSGGTGSSNSSLHSPSSGGYAAGPEPMMMAPLKSPPSNKSKSQVSPSSVSQDRGGLKLLRSPESTHAHTPPGSYEHMMKGAEHGEHMGSPQKDLDSMFNGQQMSLQDFSHMGVGPLMSPQTAGMVNHHHQHHPHHMSGSSHGLPPPSALQPAIPPIKIKKKRGRPRKIKEPTPMEIEAAARIEEGAGGPMTMPHITPMTPVRADKLSHKVAPTLPPSGESLIVSVPLHHMPSPAAPMDLSSVTDGITGMAATSPLQHLDNIGTQCGAISPNMDPVVLPQQQQQPSVPEASNCSKLAYDSSRQPPSSPIKTKSDPKANSPTADRFDATPNSPVSSCEDDEPGETSAASSSNVKSPQQPSYPSIEDDLGFLAELPPACNIAARPPQNRQMPTAASPFKARSGGVTSTPPSANGGMPKKGGFLDSFLKFVQGDPVPSLSNVSSSPGRKQVGTRGGRGRGRGVARSVQAESPSTSTLPTPVRRVVLDPDSGLFVARNTPTPPSSGRGSPTADLMDDLNALDTSSPSEQSYSPAASLPDESMDEPARESKSADSQTAKQKAGGSDEAHLSTDEDRPPADLGSFVETTIQDPDDAARSEITSKLKMDDSDQEGNAFSNGSKEGGGGHPELKIKVVGLQSGRLQTARRGSFRSRGSSPRGRSSFSRFTRKRRRNSDSEEDEEEEIYPPEEEEDSLSPLGMDDAGARLEVVLKEEDPTPRRELSMRKCKEKVIMKMQEKQQKRIFAGMRRQSRLWADSREDSADEIEAFLSSSSESEIEPPPRVSRRGRGRGTAIRYDSDDPAWTPAVAKEGVLPAVTEDVTFPTRAMRRSRAIRGGRGGRLSVDIAEEPFVNPVVPVSVVPAVIVPKPISQPVVVPTPAPVVPTPPPIVPILNLNNPHMAIVRESTGKTGDFVMAVADKNQDRPPIWRIDGKSLLQKFEPFEQDGRLLYRNKSTYAGWTASSRNQYKPITVKLLNSNRNSIVVEYIKTDDEIEVLEEKVPVEAVVITAEIPDDDDDDEIQCVEPEPIITELHEDKDDLDAEVQELLVTEAVSSPEVITSTLRKESFEVYIQTLISQSLDPNFISEIIKEQDEYFLSHMQEIDDAVDRSKSLIVNKIKWTVNLRDCVEIFPCMEISDCEPMKSGDRNCQVCHEDIASKTLTFSGQLYNYTTLIHMASPPPDRELANKAFRVCEACAAVVSLYNQTHHQKFTYYSRCFTKVNQIKEEEPSMESHVVLEHCLRDSAWINQLFSDAQEVWKNCGRLPDR